MTSTSRLRRAVSRLLVPGLLVAAARPAAAQAACAPDQLSTYVQLGFTCDLAGWNFSDFFFASDAAADGSTSAFAPANDGSDVLVTPFSSNVGGVLRFGFLLDGLNVNALADGGAGLDGSATARALFGFLSQNTTTSVGLTHAGFDAVLAGGTGTPGRTDLYQFMVGSIVDQAILPPPSTGECVSRIIENFGPGLKPRSVLRQCDEPNPTAVSALFYLEADAARSTSPRTQSGFSSIVLSQVVLQTVPEPATVALLAGGLLALGGVAAERRRRA